MAAGVLRPGDPERLGPYRLVGRLGEGGQGTVFLAVAEHGAHGTGGRVAVKLLRGGLGGDPEARARFLRELETAKRVAEFCTAAILDADVAGDRPYIVSEFVDGPSLHRVVTTEGPRAGGALERVAVGTATALVAIHRAGVVHRDFKPQNVLLGRDGPRVIDFGIARAMDAATITVSGMIGTPAFMAPEQLEGDRAGAAADVFAWGATMVFASSGRHAFAGDTMTATVGRILHGEPDLGELTGPLRDLVVRCLAKDPAARPSAAELLSVLLGQADGGPAAPVPPAGAPTMRMPSAPAEPAPPGPLRPKRRVPGVVAVSAAVAAVAAAAAVTAVALAGRDGGQERGPRAGGGDPRPAASSAPASRSPAPSSTRSSSPPPSPPRGPDVAEARQAGIPGAHAGTWDGRVRQNDGKILRTTVVLPAGGRTGRIGYPEQRCSGVLVYLGGSGGALRFQERITSGADRCVETGSVTLTPEPAGDRLLFRYAGTSRNGRHWAVTGFLSRS